MDNSSLISKQRFTPLMLAKNIKNLRRLKGWSQEDLAYFSNFSTNYISLLERAKRIPSIKALEVLAELFEIKLEELFKDY